MDNKLDDALKSHFSKREDVPLATKDALRAKLYAAAQSNAQAEKLRWIWLLAPCAMFVPVLLLAVTNALFGWVTVLIILAGYYFVAAMGGTTIIITMLLKNTRIRSVSFT